MAEIVALMMSRNEVDFVGEVVESWLRRDIPLFVIDDSDDGTYEVLSGFKGLRLYRQSDFFEGPVHGACDWILNFLLEKQREAFGSRNHVLIAHADEIWLHSPRKIVAAMQAEGAETLMCRTCNHLLHPRDMAHFDFERGAWRPEAAALPMALRMPWYTAHWLEIRGFRDRDHYRLARDGGLLPRDATGPEFSRRPLIQHHSIRSPVQAIARAKDRVERRVQPAYEPYYYRRDPEEVFYEAFPEIGVELMRYEGSYGELEIGLEDLR